MSMVSSDLVDSSHYTGEYESLTLANGLVIRRPLAKVTFDIRGRVFDQLVAVSQQGERTNFVFLSSPPKDEDDAIKSLDTLCDREVERHKSYWLSLYTSLVTLYLGVVFH